MSDTTTNKLELSLGIQKPENVTQEQIQAAYALNLCSVSVSQIIDYNDIYILEQFFLSVNAEFARKKRCKRLTYQAFLTFAQNTHFFKKTACFQSVHFCNLTKSDRSISTNSVVKKMSFS